MKIDRSRIKKSTLEVPPECQALIEKLWLCSQGELLQELKKIDTWTFGKCELYHWIDILDVCDSILEHAAKRVSPKSWQLVCDLPENEELKELLLWVLHFTTLLIEHSFSRHLYNSVEHLLTLLSSCDLHVVLGVLNLLYMFSKRSNFIARLMPEMRSALLKCLTYLAESWGGRENGFGLADCCRDNPMYCPPSATTVHYEFYSEETPTGRSSQVSCIHLENVDKLDKTPAEIMNSLIEAFNVPSDGQMLLFTHIRLAYAFSDYRRRLYCVQARLQALSVLLYSNSFTEIQNLLYPGILDELVELLELQDPQLVEIRAAALRTLTSITHLDRSPRIPLKPGSRLNMIIDVTGAGLYHGFLPQMVRNCITSLTTEKNSDQFPLPLATALFSFLYHLASYEAGGEALVSCGMMECLLRVINWPGTELEHITFVTRAVRVIDLITNIDMQAFQAHGGLTSFINRLQMEMTICRKEQPFEIQVQSQSSAGCDVDLDEEMMRINVDSDSNPSTSKAAPMPMPSTSADLRPSHGKTGKTCLPQRAALLKSMLNFLKKALQDPSFSESMRHVMDGSLPSSLKHIISNAEYYGPSLFLLATDVVTAYVFQEPQYLSSLQDNGLTDVVLHALLVKNVPATREVLGSLPNVFSALCLNPRGLASFVRFSPFDRLFKVLLSPMYLSAMRRRRSTDPIGDTASNLGNAMDELMRHQPTLKADATAAIIKLLEELCALGRDPKYICWRPQKGSSGESPLPTPRVPNEAGSSDEEEDDEEEASTSSHPQREDASVDQSSQTPHEKTPIALVDYILNVMKFVDAILSNNSTDDHCREFVNQKGLVPLLSILGLPNLPVDYPVTLAAQSVASVCKSILNLAHEPQVMRQGLSQLNDVLTELKPLYRPEGKRPEGSLLLHELASAPKLESAFSTPSATPLLHAVAAANGYVVMFVHVCRTGQLDIRTISMTHWGSDLGLQVLKLLCELYTALVWESTILLALCSDDASTSSKFSKDDIDKLFPPEMRLVEDSSGDASGNMTSAMEALSTEPAPTNMEVDEQHQAPKKKGIPSAIQMKYIKPLLGASSRLGRALAELFGLLVKLCVGFPVRTRRGNHLTNTPVSPTPAALEVAKMLATLLATGLNYKSLPPAPMPKFRLTYLICSVGFTSPMLFDEKKFPYHLMLQKFVQCGGQKAFFDTFYWAVSGGNVLPLESGLEHPDLPDGTGEFLDAWLILLEKMVNPKAILESTHMLPTRTTQQGVQKMFDPLKYLQHIHKEAFNAIKLLWGKKPLKTYGPRMIETVLTIMKHILRGEKCIEERKLKEVESNGREGNDARRRERPEVNLTELQQLMDMGFSREHCYEALILTATMEHATDYLLNNFFPHNSSRTNTQQPSMETEEDQLYQAIAMSLGESGQSPAEANPSSMSIEEETEVEPIQKEELDKFTEEALPVCLNMLEKLPDTVYHVCSLLNTILRRNGETFSYKLLNALASKINSKVEYLLEACNSLTPEDPDLVSVLVHSLDAHRAAAIIHLYMLLFEDIKVPCAKVVHTSRMLPNLIDLLSRGTKVLARCEAPETPKWMAPLLLLIDLLEKVSQVTTRKAAMHRYTSHVWRWFDLTTGKWTLYSPVNNKLINDAYWRGESLLRIASGRRRYTIIFHQMIQTNEDSGKQRPIMRSLLEPAKEQPGTTVPSNELFPSPPEKSPSSSSAESMEVEGDSDFFHRRSAIQSIQGVSPEDAANIVYACVCLMDIPVNKDTLHAAMQLCVRFTRDYQNAKAVAKMGVVKILLKLRQNCVFPGFSGLATILIRHILEEPLTLELAFEKVLRAKTLQNIPPSYKELHYILRECSSAVCRDTAAFRRVAERILRVDLTALNKRGDEEDNRLLMKSVVTNEGRQNLLHVCIEETSRQTVYDLLNALAIVYDDDVEDNCQDKGDSAVCSDMTPTSTTSSSSSEGTSGSRQAVSGSAPVSSSDHTSGFTSNWDSMEQNARGFDQPSATRSTGNQGNPFPDLLNSEQSAAGGQTSSSSSTISAVHQNASLPLYMVAQAQSQNSGGVYQSTQHFQSEQSEAPEKMRKLPLLSKSAILKILGDAVRSYTTIAKLITEYTYSANEVEMIKEDCSAIAFVLDHLMPARDGMTDHELPNMARGLIAALSSCNHSPDAQLTLVSEVKSALARTLAMPESSRKHQHIQDLVGIVTIMIENCPPVPINTPLTSALKLSQFSVNNMVRFMMRKGIITDLSRIPHSLDLSSPKMAATMNAVLKPLESLSRIMSCPSSVATAAAAKLKAKRTVPMPASDEPPSSQTGTSASEATNAQGEETVEDADNTEHDVSAAVDICSEEPINPPDDADEADADEMIEHLIDRDVPPTNDTDAGEQNTGFIFDESIETSTSDLTYQPMSQNEEASESSSDDSDSNGSEEERRMDDPATDIDDQVDDEEEDEAEGDDNEITDHYAEEVLEMFEAEQGLLGIPGIDHESDDFLMIEYAEPSAHSTPLMPWISSSFSLPFSLFEEASNGNDNASLNQIPSLHPLLMTRQNLDQGGLSSSRTQRLMNRTRRYQYVQMNRSSATPLFLQRVGQGDPVPFIGSGGNSGNNSSSNNDVISSAFGNNTRVVVMDNGLGIFTNSEEEQINFVDQSGYLLGPSLAATLNNVPTSMHWWNEEARILDGDSQADCAVVVGYETSPVFLRFRNEELAERREKHKKQDEEEQKKCNTDTDKKKLYNQGPSRSIQGPSRSIEADQNFIVEGTDSDVEPIVFPPTREFRRAQFERLGEIRLLNCDLQQVIITDRPIFDRAEFERINRERLRNTDGNNVNDETPNPVTNDPDVIIISSDSESEETNNANDATTVADEPDNIITIASNNRSFMEYRNANDSSEDDDDDDTVSTIDLSDILSYQFSTDPQGGVIVRRRRAIARQCVSQTDGSTSGANAQCVSQTGGSSTSGASTQARQCVSQTGGISTSVASAQARQCVIQAARMSESALAQSGISAIASTRQCEAPAIIINPSALAPLCEAQTVSDRNNSVVDHDRAHLNDDSEDSEVIVISEGSEIIVISDEDDSDVNSEPDFHGFPEVDIANYPLLNSVLSSAIANDPSYTGLTPAAVIERIYGNASAEISGQPVQINSISDTSDVDHVPSENSAEIMNIFEQSPRAPPLRPTTRRIAMLTAAQEVAQATENLAGSIVESVLHPRAIEPPHGRQQPSTSYLEVPSDPSMVHIASSEPADNTTESTVVESSPTASQTLLGDNMRCESMGSISPPPPLLPLTPINAGQSDLSDPLGLIPGSVPFPPPADPDDGFFRVNPPEELQTEQRPNSEDNELGELPPLPCGALDMTNSTPSSTSSSPFVINRINITAMHRVSEDPPLDYEFTVNNWLLPSLPSLNSNSTSQSSLPPPPPLPPPSVTQPQPLHQEQQSESSVNVENSSSTTQQNQSNAATASVTSGTNVVATVGNQPQEQTSSDDNNQEVPEGVDPSFLAALPDELRSEVIAEHLRLQRLRTRAEAQSQSGEVSRGGSTIEVNPDFLAALPPNIQEEVLAQQRLEQQRQAATSSNPNEPVDAAAFFQDLPHALRQAILTDMEESQMSALPPEIVAEAQNLRREWEARNRQLMQERFLSHVTHNTTTLSSILRTPSPRSGSRQSAARYAIQSVSPRSPWAGWPARQDQQTSMNLCAHSRASNVRTRGRQILDYESICCLLVLLFVDDSRLNTVRLHRVFRNLCYHPPTREWIIKALLSIMEKSNEGNFDGNGTGFGHPLGISGSSSGRPVSKRMTTRSQSQIQAAEPNHISNNVNMRNNSSWLNISMDAALGCRATVFHVQKVPGRRTERTVTINPQAAPFVYRHALDILISLAKTFPSCFVPTRHVQGDEMIPVPSNVNKTGKANRTDSSNFWDLLIRLDSVTSKKGKNTTKSTSQPQDTDVFSIETSPFGQLLRMLAAPVVRRSPVLMDKLLRLLSLISVGLQVNKGQQGSNSGNTGGASSNVNYLSYEPIIGPNTLNHLSLVIKVLTSNTCSEEGLEDATALLLNISVNIESIRDTVLTLLLQGARNMAENVCSHINALLRELQELNRHHSQQSEELDDNSIESRMSNMKGILSNRFTKDTVVVTAPKKVKSGLDLQLSSMAPLISKTSSQAFFLRVLKVIAQMRESVQNVDTKKNDNGGGESEEQSATGNRGSNGCSLSYNPVSDRTVMRLHRRELLNDALFMDTHRSTRNSSHNNDFELECDADCDAETASVLEKSRVQLLSEQLNLDHLWDTLSNCLTELAHTQDSHAVLVLQPAVEAFFLVHASNEKKQLDKERAGLSANNVPSGSQGLSDELAPAPRPLSPLPPTPICNEAAQSSSHNSGSSNDENAASQKTQQKFLKFAETHRTVLNQILRQCSTPLLEGPFAVLVNHTRVLDFDVKRRYFRSELERADEGHRREEIAVHVRRNQIFEDSFRELHRRAADDWKNRFYIVFEGEEGQDAGGLLREWYMIISREIFNPMYALFTTSPGDRVTYMINPASHCNHNHLCYFKFVGRVIAKAIYDNKLLECYFTRSLYKHILGIPVKYTDMESEDYSFYQGLVYMMENHISSLGYDPTFSTEVQEFGVTEVRDLLPNGRNILVTEENKMDYIQLVCKMKMTGAIRQQLQSFLEGFYEIIPKKLISIFNEQELELLISGLPNVDIDELKANTEYYKYQPNSLQIQWFWRALREFDQAERAKFLQFVTGTSKVPLQGFGALEGMNGTQKFQIHRDERSTDRLPSAHTCFNQLDLPVYETYTKLRTYLLKAIHECSEGFGFA